MKKIILTILLALSINLYAQPVEFTLKNTEGKEINIVENKKGLTFKEYKGKAIFLTIFGHNCPPCNLEIPEFIDLTNKYPNKLEIVAIEAQGYKNDELKKFKTEKNINYNLISGENHTDFVKYLSKNADWEGAIPFIIAIDKNGAVQYIDQGFIEKGKLEELINQLTK